MPGALDDDSDINPDVLAPRATASKRTLAVELMDSTAADLREALLRKGYLTSLHQLCDLDSRHLLAELAARKGTIAAVAEAQLLVIQKSQDYNQSGDERLSAEQALLADRDAYFPFGVASYVHMLHVKAQRAVSLARKQMAGGEANFEGLRDTALDLINYASFLVERLDRGDLK